MAPPLVAATVPWGPADALAFLAAHPGEARLLVEDPDGTVRAGVGVAASVTAEGEGRFARLDGAARDLLGSVRAETGDVPPLLGGFAFGDARPDAPWEGFPSAWLALPRLLLVVGPDGVRLTAVAADARAARAAIEEARVRRPAAAPAPTVKFDGAGDRARWVAAATDTLAALRRGEAEKVVLARALAGEASAPLDPVRVLAAVRANGASRRFLVEPRPGLAFLGASPELLVSVRGHDARTAAVAGSARRGATPDEHARLAAELLRSPKERHEHAVVIDAIWRSLSGLASEIRLGGSPGTLTAGPVQHLVTEVAARLHEPYGALRLAAALHPTPAVGGTPARAALSLMSDAETFDRGWYAGGVGWVGPTGEGTFLVALRSALVRDARVTAFAGAGLVAESDPSREWDETDLKLGAMLDAFAEMR